MSLFFYAWGEPAYVLLLLASTIVNYVCGRLIGKARTNGQRRVILWAAIILDLGALGFYKYAGFLVQTIMSVTGLKLASPDVSLPIGISFYTFQALSYVIDVYRGNVAVQKHYSRFLLYISLFPQLIAGPIVRYSEIEPQLAKRRTTPKGAFLGLTRFCIGLGKKVLIANYAGAVASQMLDGNLLTQTALQTWLGVIMYSFQIYFDFSGYSDMAIGLGRIFGFRYSENFNLPYMSGSITEFWRRWHISLSSFFRDYVYIPLGGNRRHQILNLLIVWSLTGLWHGASWNFVLWGLYYFVLLTIEKRSLPMLKKVPGVIRHVLTLFLVAIGWTLFYCTDLSRLGQTLQVMFGFGGAGWYNTQTAIMLKNNLILLLIGAIGSTVIPRYAGICVMALFSSNEPGSLKQRTYTILAYLFDVALLVLCTISLIGSSYNPFLYFRF